MPIIEITIMPTLEPTNTLMMPPTIMTIAPTNNHFPMPERSLLITEAQLAMTKKTPAVPPNAVITREEPFLKPNTAAIKLLIIRPMKKVKPKRTGTPAAEFLVFSMA